MKSTRLHSVTRPLLLGGSLFVAAAALFLGCRTTKPTSKTTPAAHPIVRVIPEVARPFPLSAVRLTGGPLKRAQDLDAKYLLDLQPDRMLAFLRQRAGLEPKAQGYGGWDGGKGKQLTGHIAGHYLSGVSYMYAATGDPRYKERADYVVAQLKEIQDKQGDGYIGAITDSQGTDGKTLFRQVSEGNIRSGGFDLNGLWSPWYVEHKIFAGLRDAYRYTGNKTALEVEIKFATWAEGLLSKLDDAQIQQMLNTEFGGMNEIAADLYADTGDKQWLTLYKKFYHKAIVDPLSQGKDILPGKHGNTQVPKLMGSLAHYIYTGQQSNGKAAMYFWDRVANHHSFATGGHGRNEYFGQPDKLNPMVDGRTCETCNVYNMLKMTRTLFSLQPDIRYADFHERALYNHILGSIDPTDGWACYMVPVGRGVTHEYERNMLDGGFTCCTGTSMESHALHAYGIYYESGDRLWVNLYAPSTAEWKAAGVSLAMDTPFPEGDSATLKLTLKSKKAFTLALRRPLWAGEGFSVKVNGEAVKDLAKAGSYVQINRTWKTGDTVTLVLPKTLREEPLPDNPRRVALMWGPLVLAGDLGPEQEGRKADVPVFVAAERPLTEWLKPVAGKPGTFHTDGVGRDKDVEFVPFYRLHRRTYGIYWDLFTPQEWQQKATDYAAAQEKQRKLEAVTVAFVQPGEMQPETDYNYRGEGATTARIMRRERAARRGGQWFSFDLPIDQAKPMALIVTYSNEERQTRSFEVLVEGQKVGEQTVERRSPEQEERLFDVEYRVPAEVIKDNQKVTVRFQATNDNQIGTVCGIRMIRVDGQQTTAPAVAVAPTINLALVATASASYVSGDTTTGALHDGINPRSSRESRRGTYGNWPSRGTQWVQYDWSQPISTHKVEVYWWDDNQGVRLPKASRLLYWDGKAFVSVPNASGLGVAGNQYNTTTFDEIKTDKLRLEIDSNDTFSTGILEWRVIDSGKSPEFPPMVKAGIDRMVVLGGKTYLNGQVKTLKSEGPSTKSVWSKESGPGTVTFAEAGSLKTTATFSAPGDYVLKLTAGEGPLSGSSTLKVQTVQPPPADRLDVVYTKAYKIDNPLWNNRAKALIVNWIPHCIDKNNDPNLREGGINNFIEAAKKLKGEPAARHRGYPFSNAWVYQTVESICIALMVDPQGDPETIKAQERMKATLEDWIPKILAAQEPDGYLQTRFTLDTRGAKHWDPRTRSEHEGYVAGYFIESAINHYTLTNGTDKRLYDAAKKLSDCWVANIGPGKKEWYDGHQEMEQALVRFGRFVNDMEGPGSHGDSYIQLAKFLLDCRKDGSEYDQSHVPVQEQYEAVGHAVRATYTYSGMADVAAETHDLDYQSAVMSLWDSMVNKKYYVTGGIGSGETSEGFGPDYSLRNEAYCESCSTCGLIFFEYKMNLAYHDAKYVDEYEESLYNALLGSVDLEGRNFYYQNPLSSGAPRYEWHNCPCCVGNIPRTLLMIPTWTYVKGKDGLYVNLFIGSTINVEKVAGTNIQMVQKTDYPWSGKVSITVNPETSKRFTVYIRVPDRTTSVLYTPTPKVSGLTAISVNGSTVTPRIDKGYAAITRDWKPGDRIDLVLPMQVQRIKADEKIAADRGLVALRYGPLIYNVEKVDQDITQVLSPESALTTEWKPDLLEGVRVVKGTFANGSPMTAIPNYARNNRGSGEPAGDTAGTGPGAIGRGRRSRAPSSIVWMKDQ